MSENSLLEVDLARLCDRQFFPSPAAWEDQVLYFLMLDRFSDGTGRCRALAGGRGTLGGWHTQRVDQQDRVSPASGGDGDMGQSDL